MVDLFLPYFFIALVSDPLITKSEYFFKFDSLEEKQADRITKEYFNITGDLRCRIVRPEATRCTIDSLTIETSIYNSTSRIFQQFGEKKTQLDCNEVRFCDPFEIIFNSTGVESLVMSDKLKNSRISTVLRIANLINVKWVDGILKQDMVQESTINGECTSRIFLQELTLDEDQILMESLFQPEITLKPYSNLTNIYKKIRDVKSCSRGKVRVSENIFSSLAYLEHSTVSSPYFIKSCIKKIIIFTIDGGEFNTKQVNSLSVDKVQLITDTELPDIIDPVTVPFLSV